MQCNDRRAASGAQELKSFDGPTLINVSVEVERVESFDDGSIGTEAVKYVDRRSGSGTEKSLELPLTVDGRGADRTVEVCRSFSRKINLEHYGGKSYESADFFASRKTLASAGEVAQVSGQIFDECVGEIHDSMLWYVREMRARRAAANAGRLQAPPAAAANAKNFEAWQKKNTQDSMDVLI